MSVLVESSTIPVIPVITPKRKAEDEPEAAPAPKKQAKGSSVSQIKATTRRIDFMAEERKQCKEARDRLLVPFDESLIYWEFLYTTEEYDTHILLFNPDSLSSLERTCMVNALKEDAQDDLFDLVDGFGPTCDSRLSGQWVVAIPEDKVVKTSRRLRLVQNMW